MQVDRLLYPVAEGAELVGIKPAKMWALIKEGRVESVKLDGRRLIRRQELERLAASLPVVDTAAS